MRAPIALLLLTLAACHPPPDEVAAKVAAALESGATADALALVHADYADPRGDRSTLAKDLADLAQSFGRVRIDLSNLEVVDGATAKESLVIGRLDAELVGAPTWRVVGPVRMTFRRDDGFWVVSGLLPHLRDIRALTEARRAALEANDAEALRPLLHPTYRDGDLDADEALAKLGEDISGAKIRMEVTNYRLEVRGPSAHLDEHYHLEVEGRPIPPQIARFTLAPSAGRWRIRAGLYGGPD